MEVAIDTSRRRLLPLEKNITVSNTRSPRLTTTAAEVSPRYRSATPTKPGRCPSPSLTRPTLSSSSHSLPVIGKRAVSAERKRPSTPTSPSTPPSLDFLPSPRTTRLPQSLWPSTMRSLTPSFQSDSVSVPVKPVIDRTLKPSLHLSQKQKKDETTYKSRKLTPERIRSPLKGKHNNAADLSENSKHVDAPNSRLIEQHRWPSRIGSDSLNRSLDLSDKPLTSRAGMGSSSLRRMSLPLHKNIGNTFSNGGLLSPTKSEDYNIARASGSRRFLTASSVDRATLAISVARLHPFSAPGSCPASPCSTTSSSISRGMSSSRGGVSPSRGLSPVRGLSPSRVANTSSFARPSTPPSRGVRQTSTPVQSSTTTSSVLSFIADVKKGKKANYIDDVHQLRMLYNRYLQWRFANARAEAVMYIQRLTSEVYNTNVIYNNNNNMNGSPLDVQVPMFQETLFNVWLAISELQDDLTSQKLGLQQLKLKIKLNSILNNQIVSLEEWARLEREYVSSLVGAIADLEANTLRLPATRETKVDIESLKASMSSALDVMVAMGSSILGLLSKVEEMNKMVSKLAVLVTKESSMQEKCQDLLASTAIMQIKECTLRTHLIQTMREEDKEDEEETLPPLLPLSMFPWP